VFGNVVWTEVLPVLLTADILTRFLKWFILVFKYKLLKLIYRCFHRLA